ncbi:MAG TPA: hypothetical protein VGA13_13475 [Acidimicrobiales bacterium]
MSRDVTPEARAIWGGLAEPMHPDAAGPDDPRWGENAYLAFWAGNEDVFGVVHVITSPNAEGRRARCTLSIEGDFAEIHEELEPGSFTSDSVSWDVGRVDGLIEVDHPSMGIEVTLAPRFDVVAFDPYSVAPSLEGRDPLVHHEAFCELEGRVRVGDSWRPIQGRGFRDRTWGFRDESASVIEWVGVLASFDDFDTMMIRFLWDDGFRDDSFFSTQQGTTQLDDFHVARNPAGRGKQARLGVADGPELTLDVVESLGIAWCPLGSERDGPSISAFDEFVTFECDGARGRGIVEQGILRRVW